MRWLEHRIPPPVVCALIGCCMWGLARIVTRLPLAESIRIGVAVAFVVAGFAVALAGGFVFRRAKTTANPLQPDMASSLVVAGVYRYTRNPMYLGFVLALIGWTVFLAAPLALLGPALFVVFMTRFQIVPEERALARKFGTEFAVYRQRVRRWL